MVGRRCSSVVVSEKWIQDAESSCMFTEKKEKGTHLKSNFLFTSRQAGLELYFASFFFSSTARQGDLKWKKNLKHFGRCHENRLIESFKMSPLLICLSWHLKTLLWPASGSGLDVIWKLIPQLRHIKWGLILKLSLRPFLSHHLESLRIFFHFKSPCRAVPCFILGKSLFSLLPQLYAGEILYFCLANICLSPEFHQLRLQCGS